MASCMTFCLIQIVIGVSCVGHIGLEVDGSVIDVLVETGLVRKLETFSEWCRVEKKLCILGDSGGNSRW